MKKISIKTMALTVVSALAITSVQAQTSKTTEEQKTKAASIPDKVSTVAGELHLLATSGAFLLHPGVADSHHVWSFWGRAHLGRWSGPIRVR